MENLVKVLMRVKGISEEEALRCTEEAKKLLESGKSSEEVLVSLYGEDVSELESILTPAVEVV